MLTLPSIMYHCIFLSFFIFHYFPCDLAFSPRGVVTSNRMVLTGVPKSYQDILRSDLKDITSTSILIAGGLFFNVPNVFADEAVKKQKKAKVLETELGIKYIELKKGSGPYPTPGDFVVINYSAFLSNGTVFDSTEIKGRKPLSFRFGRKQQIEGLESVLSYMQPGGECTCTIPPKYAFGEEGICIKDQGCLVPPNETLKYVIKLKQVAPSYS